MSEASAETKAKVSIQARVFRIAWDRKPKFISQAIWLWLGKRRIWYTGRWENLGEIASSEKGTAAAEFVPHN